MIPKDRNENILKKRLTFRNKLGNVPGNMVFTGDRKVQETTIHYLEYGAEFIKTKTQTGDAFNRAKKPKEGIDQWYDIRGLHDLDVITKIGDAFKVHALVREDIVDVNQRPKYEEYKEGIFIVMNPLFYDEKEDRVNTEMASLYFGDDFLLSFQETSNDVFSEVRDRIIEGRGRIRSKEVDYLAYALIDKVVDSYVVIMDQIEEDLEELELNILRSPKEVYKDRIHYFKVETLKIRKAVSPLKEAIYQILNSEHNFINEDTKIYVRDVDDHLSQVYETLEGFRDRLSGLQDLYISEVTFKMNKVMQLLTIVTAIFVPLSFIVGLYGMNFENMPELHYKYGYYIVLAVMGLIVFSMIYYFKKKDWL